MHATCPSCCTTEHCLQWTTCRVLVQLNPTQHCLLWTTLQSPGSCWHCWRSAVHTAPYEACIKLQGLCKYVLQIVERGEEEDTVDASLESIHKQPHADLFTSLGLGQENRCVDYCDCAEHVMLHLPSCAVSPHAKPCCTMHPCTVLLCLCCPGKDVSTICYTRLVVLAMLCRYLLCRAVACCAVWCLKHCSVSHTI